MHRCARHIRVKPHNLHADGGREECGACVMEEVFFLHHSRLDLLDTIAGLLQSHAEMRKRLADSERRLAYYEPERLKES